MTDETFERAARMFGDMLYRVAYHALKNRADAEDVVQTVLLKLYQQTDGFESEAHLKHWLLRVTVNESRKLLRSFWRRNTVPLEDAEKQSGGLSPEEFLDERENSSRAYAALHRLPEPYKEVFLLRALGELSFRQIGNLFGKTENWACVTYHRARAKVKAEMEESE